MATRRAQRQAVHGRDEMLGMLVSCISGAAVLAFISPQLLRGTLGYLLGGGALFASVFAVIFHLRQGGSMAGAFLLVMLTGSLTAGSMYGIWWYSFVYLASQPNLFNVSALGQSVQQPMLLQPTSTSIPATSSAALVAAPSADASKQCGRARVQGVEALALRAEPTQRAAQLGAVPEDEVVDLACTPTVISDNIVWQKVRWGNTNGWMSTRFLQGQQP